MSEYTLQGLLDYLVNSAEIDTDSEVAITIQNAIAREAELRAANERLEEKCNKLIWQVRDTCVRAEKAEKRVATLENDACDAKRYKW